MVEAYVDDIVIKSKKRGDLIQDLEIAFGCLRANEIKLNPEKCVFGVPRGMLLGYIVSQCGIEANPEKVLAITRMGPIRDIKGVQRFTGSGAESLYLEVRRKGVATVSTPKESRAFLLDPRGRGSPRQLEENTDLSTSPGPTSTRRTSASVRCLDDPGRQCSHGSREAGRGACSASPEASLFHQRGALGNQGTIPADPEANICRNPRPTQAAALLPWPPYHGGC